jgi:hypothetical protein
MGVGGDGHRPPLPLPLAQGRLQSLAIDGEAQQPEPGGQAGLESKLLGALAALFQLTRLTSLTVNAEWLPHLEGDRGAPPRVLRALPRGLKQVGHGAVVVGRGFPACKLRRRTFQGTFCPIQLVVPGPRSRDPPA